MLRARQIGALGDVDNSSVQSAFKNFITGLGKKVAST